MQQSPLRALLELGLWPGKQLIEKRRSLRGWLRPILYLFSMPLVVGVFALGALGYLFSGLADLFTGFRFKLTKRFYQLTNKPVSKGRYEVERFLRKQGLALSYFFGKINESGILCNAASEGNLEVVQYFAARGADPAAGNGIGLISAASNGHLAVVQYLTGVAGVQPDLLNNMALSMAVQHNHIEVVLYLVGLDEVGLAARNAFVLRWAVSHNQLEMIRAFAQLDDVDLSAGDYFPYHCAAREGYLEALQALITLQDIPVEEKNRILCCAIYEGRPAVVAYLLGLEGVNPANQNARAWMLSIECGNPEVPGLLLADGRVTVTPNNIMRARMNGHISIITLLENHLARSPSEQRLQLLVAHQDILVYERQTGLSDSESAMNPYLECQAEQQQAFLSERYAEESLSSGQRLLRELVFRTLQSHIESNTPEAEEKLRFLSERMNDLIAGETEALSEAVALFNSNEDIYEIASRTVNVQAPTLGIWPNLLTAEGEAGEWVQSYVGNIAREIAASEGQSHYEGCLSALIYRLAEIRRAHNEGDVVEIDNPSCFPGTKTRLLKVLESHPEHSQYVRPEWKAACYEGAARHIEQVFGQVLDEMDSREDAEQLYDALLMMRLENAEAIEEGAPLLTSGGDRKAYDNADGQRRLVFIERVRQGLQESINAYLCEHDLDPILKEDTKVVYLRFLEFALGEAWIASRLSAVYIEHAPKAASEDDLEDVSQAVLNLRLAAQARQQQADLQGLKRRFYEHCEQHYPEAALSAGEVNAFFAGVEMPSETDEAAFFEDAFKRLASDESHEGRQSPSP